MSNRKARKPPTIKQQLKFVKENKDLIPSLAKYSHRKTQLTRWERSAITRARKKIAFFGGRKTLFPLTKKQAKRIEEKHLIVGHGIRGIRVNNPSPETKIRISKNGKITIIQSGRVWRIIPHAPDPEIAENIAARVMRKHKPRGFALQTTNGRSDAIYPTPSRYAEKVAEYTQKYNEDMSDWFIGLAWF